MQFRYLTIGLNRKKLYLEFISVNCNKDTSNFQLNNIHSIKYFCHGHFNNDVKQLLRALSHILNNFKSGRGAVISATLYSHNEYLKSIDKNSNFDDGANTKQHIEPYILQKRFHDAT